MVYFILWVMYEFPHQFPIGWINYNKTYCMGRTCKIGTQTFPQYGCFSSHWKTLVNFFGKLHHLGNKWVSPSSCHSIGKCSEIHRIGRACEIGTHTFPKAWLLFFHQIPILWYTLPNKKYIVFPINFP